MACLQSLAHIVIAIAASPHDKGLAAEISELDASPLGKSVALRNRQHVRLGEQHPARESRGSDFVAKGRQDRINPAVTQKAEQLFAHAFKNFDGDIRISPAE